MAKYILNETLYNTKKMKLLCSSITRDIYIANDGKFIEVGTFYGIPIDNARFINESYAKSIVGSEGNWKTYQEVWGYVPED